MTISRKDVAGLTSGKTSVVGSDGERIGDLVQVYTSDETGEPTWATVKTGLFGTQESFVPLAGGRASEDNLHVAVDKEAVKNAPRVDADGHLSPEEEDNLYRYYGVSEGDQGPGDQGPAAVGTQPDSRRDVGDRADDRVGDDRGGDDRGGDDRGGDRFDDRGGDRSDDRGGDRFDDRAGDQGVGADEADSRSGPQASPDQISTPGERTTKLRRFVVTERVVQSVEELPDEGGDRPNPSDPSDRSDRTT